METNSSLKKFHNQYCPDLPIDSPEVFYKLASELNNIKGKEKHK